MDYAIEYTSLTEYIFIILMKIAIWSNIAYYFIKNYYQRDQFTEGLLILFVISTILSTYLGVVFYFIGCHIVKKRYNVLTLEKDENNTSALEKSRQLLLSKNVDYHIILTELENGVSVAWKHLELHLMLTKSMAQETKNITRKNGISTIYIEDITVEQARLMISNHSKINMY